MKFSSTFSLRLNRLTLVAGGLLLGMMGGLIWRTALAAPISPSAQTRAAAYQGVVSVVPGSVGDSLLELGATGQDIAGTGDIYLRPASLASGVSIRLRNVGGKTNLEIQGKLCLNGSCRDVWPGGAGGSNTWELVGSRLIPLTRTYGVTIQGSGSTNPALSIVGNHPDAALYSSNISAGASATALTVNSPVWSEIFGDIAITSATPSPLTVYDPVSGTDKKVWYRENDGAGTTLNAGRLDTIDVMTHSTSSDCNFVHTTCLCGYVEGFAYRCITLWP